MPVPSRSTKSTGGTELENAATVLADELNDDFNTLYNLLNAGLDSDNFDPSPASLLDPATLINDSSANAAAMKATSDPGVSDSENLPTSLDGEIKVIRYALERLCTGVGVTRVNGGGTTTGAWYDIPAKGRNLISSPRFPYKTSATASDPPNFWTKVGTPTSLNLGTTDASEGAGNELQVVADAGDEGVSQSIGFLKPSTKYLVVARLKVASGTAKLDTTGADAASDFRNVSITTTSSTFTTVVGVVQTDATPTALLLRVLSSGAAATFDVSYVGCFECSDDFTFDDIAVPGLIAEDSSESFTAAQYTSAGWSSVPGTSVTITVPGPGYGLEVKAWAGAEINAGGGQLDIRLTADINSGGANKVGTTRGLHFSSDTQQATISLDYAIESVTSGDEYVFQLEGQSGTRTLDANPTSNISGDVLGSGIIVKLIPTGA